MALWSFHTLKLLNVAKVRGPLVCAARLSNTLNITDLLTKPLSSAIFNRLTAAVNIQDIRNMVKVD
jgi:hypothetical protein